MSIAPLIVIGGGLAGCEAAWQAAEREVDVVLYEMRPSRNTPAHQTALLAELVCSNSLGSNLPDRAPGLLKAELRRLGSLIMAVADKTALPAGGALAVDRESFSRKITEKIENHPRITVCRQEITTLPDKHITIIATGPLTADALAADIARLTGQAHLFFYDAMAPIVSAESVDMSKAFRASRYGRGKAPEGDYLNCPLTQAEYDRFVEALLAAERTPLRDFEQQDAHFFEACLPIEVIAARGHQALAFGPLKPVGLINPHTGERPYAVVQLRQDNAAATLYNMVGFQTNLRWSEQARVFRLIPGLEKAEFVRYGQMHRNTYLNSPVWLAPTLAFKTQETSYADRLFFADQLFFAGQITGTEGYIGSTASGLIAGINAARRLQGKPPVVPPPTTMIGALLRYITRPQSDFQPMKANMGLLPPLPQRLPARRNRFTALAERALQDLSEWIVEEHV